MKLFAHALSILACDAALQSLHSKRVIGGWRDCAKASCIKDHRTDALTLLLAFSSLFLTFPLLIVMSTPLLDYTVIGRPLASVFHTVTDRSSCLYMKEFSGGAITMSISNS